MIQLVTVSGRPVCPFSHTVKRDGTWRRGDAPEAPILITQANGVQQTKLQCVHCGQATGALPAALTARWNLGTPTEMRDNRGQDTCSVATCDSREIEWHHFAPRAVFTTEADDWPVMPLCRPHHTEWHRRMDGYRWTRRAIA